MPHPGRPLYSRAPDTATSIASSLDQPVVKSESRPETPILEKRPSRINPFATPYSSNAQTRASSPALRQVQAKPYFHSRRVTKGEVQKPWIAKKDPHEKWVTIIALIGIAVGLGLAGLLVWGWIGEAL